MAIALEFPHPEALRRSRREGRGNIKWRHNSGKRLRYRGYETALACLIGLKGADIALNAIALVPEPSVATHGKAFREFARSDLLGIPATNLTTHSPHQHKFD